MICELYKGRKLVTVLRNHHLKRHCRGPFFFLQIWSVLSGAQLYVSRDSPIGVSKLCCLTHR